MNLLELPDEMQAALRFLVSLGVGLLLGLERERRPAPKAGLRTFALVALFGTAAGLLAEALDSPWVIAVGLAAVGAMIVVAYAGVKRPEDDPGTTTVIALMFCYSLGVMIWLGYDTLAVALGIAATILLYFRTELHGFTARLSPQDLASMLQFAVLTFIILPFLPDRGFGPYQALNPYHVWLMVVLVSGLSLVGYLSLRLLGQRRGVLLTGFLGGLVSSTATTLVYSRQARRDASYVQLSGSVIVLASIVVLVRIAFITGVVALETLPRLAPILLFGVAFGVAVTWMTLGRRSGTTDAFVPEFSNPSKLAAALGFGALYAVVLVLSAWLSDRMGSVGLYGFALVSGLGDVDAILLSVLKLSSAEKITGTQAVTAIVLATAVNLAFKLALVLWLGGLQLAKRCAPALLATGAGLALGLMLFR
jgi:uncharacterized membrane protein (DUF4010 family)